MQVIFRSNEVEDQEHTAPPFETIRQAVGAGDRLQQRTGLKNRARNALETERLTHRHLCHSPSLVSQLTPAARLC
jgi:hypothetical protein